MSLSEGNPIMEICKATLLPMPYQLSYFLFPFSPHLLIRFTSFECPPHISTSPNLIHLKLSLFSSIKSGWALTFLATSINLDTWTNDHEFHSAFIIITRYSFK